MVRCGFKNEYRKYICLKDNGLSFKNMITILGIIQIPFHYQHRWLVLITLFISITLFCGIDNTL